MFKRGLQVLSEAVNHLDLIEDDLSIFKVTFDKSVIDAKGVAYDYYGQYSVYIQGGDSRACCHTNVDEVIQFTYTLENICEDPGMISFNYTDLLLTSADTG